MSDTSLIDAILLGILQGLTEFLPISSSAHLIIGSWYLDGKTMPLEFNLALHFGTALAVLIYFWQDWRNLLMGFVRWVNTRESNWEVHILMPALIIGSIPAAILGLSFEEAIETYFHKRPLTIVLPLALVGILLWWADQYFSRNKDLKDLTLKDALLIGCAQATALIPGVSRSGATITTARSLGFSRVSAARFSFLLGAPAIVGATILKSRHMVSEAASHPEFYAGVAASFLAGMAAIHFLLKFIQRFGFMWFAIYRFVVAVWFAIVYWMSMNSV